MNSKGEAIAIVTVPERQRGRQVYIPAPSKLLSLSAELSDQDLNEAEAKEHPLVLCENAGTVKNAAGVSFMMLEVSDDEAAQQFHQLVDGVALERMKRKVYFNGFMAGMKAKAQEKDAGI